MKRNDTPKSMSGKSMSGLSREEKRYALMALILPLLAYAVILAAVLWWFGLWSIPIP
jgi:hypothetical protein